MTTLPVRPRRTDPTNPLAASPLGITVDDVVAGWRGAPKVFVGHSPDGQRWVVAHISGDDAAAPGAADRWLCAPASELAVRCLLSGRTTAVNLFLHSSTGMIEDVVLRSDGRFSDSLRVCGDLHKGELLSLTQLLVHDRCA